MRGGEKGEKKRKGQYFQNIREILYFRGHNFDLNPKLAVNCQSRVQGFPSANVQLLPFAEE